MGSQFFIMEKTPIVVDFIMEGYRYEFLGPTNSS